MNLYAVHVANLGTHQAFAVRAEDPAHAVMRLLAHGDLKHFEALTVAVLDESLADAPEEGAQA